MTKKKWYKRKRYWLMGLIIVGLGYWAFDFSLKTVYYEVITDKVEKEITIGLVADLHSCNYGEKQSTLTSAIHLTKPDVLLLAGDIIDDEMPPQKAWEFLEWAGQNYPSYYVTGNHEYWIGDIDKVRQTVKDYGIRVLQGESDILKIGQQQIQILGINDREAKLENWERELEMAGSAIDTGLFSVLLTHRPEEIEKYLKYPFDLVVAGHAHGGQWRIPGIINGVFAPNQGLFPKYAGGRYDFDRTTFVVSRGLARESTRIPRIFNRPEYVVIKLIPKK